MFPDRISRRRFLAQATVAGTAVLTAGNWSQVCGANEKLRVASVGVGGKGWSDVTSVAASPQVAVVALCDIDETPQHLGRAAEKFPQAKRFIDWGYVFVAVGADLGLLARGADALAKRFNG